MKKLIFFLLFILPAIAFSQSTHPRFGTTSADDNTGRILTYHYAAIVDTAGADSTVLKPVGWHNIYRITLLDSFTLKSPTVTASYLGDELILICTAATGTPKLKFSGTNWVAGGTATLSSGLRAVITFVFDGSKYVEKSRVVQ